MRWEYRRTDVIKDTYTGGWMDGQMNRMPGRQMDR
jgi:hypothetical protein